MGVIAPRDTQSINIWPGAYWTDEASRIALVRRVVCFPYDLLLRESHTATLGGICWSLQGHPGRRNMHIFTQTPLHPLEFCFVRLAPQLSSHC